MQTRKNTTTATTIAFTAPQRPSHAITSTTHAESNNICTRENAPTAIVAELVSAGKTRLVMSKTARRSTRVEPRETRCSVGNVKTVLAHLLNSIGTQR